MKKRELSWIIGSMATVALLLSGCSTATLSGTSATTTYDDIYGAHDRTSIAAEKLQEKERVLALREAQILQREQAADELAERLSQPVSQTEDGYSAALSSSYQESYEHRLRGMQSGTYKVAPSSKLTSGSLISYVSAYDPAQYNVMVSGDEVWVEPKYITSMFGRWGGVSNISVNIGLFGFPSYGWGSRAWGYPYYGSNWGYGWGGYPYYGSNWGYGWGGYPYYGWGWGGYPSYGHHHHGGYYPGGGSYPGGYYPGSGVIYGKTGNSNYRSPGSNVGTGSLQNQYSGMGSGGGGSYYRRAGSTASSGSSSGSSGSFTRPSSTSNSGNSSSGNTSYRGSSTNSNYNNNSSSNSYRSNSSSYTPSTSNSSVSSGGGGGSFSSGGGGGGGGTGYRR